MLRVDDPKRGGGSGAIRSKEDDDGKHRIEESGTTAESPGPLQRESEHGRGPHGISDRRPGPGIGDCKRNRCPHLRPRLRRRTRGGGATPVGSSNASLTVKICGLYRDGAASRPSLFEPKIGLIRLGGNKGGIVGCSRVASPSRNRVIRSEVATVRGPVE